MIVGVSYALLFHDGIGYGFAARIDNQATDYLCNIFGGFSNLENGVGAGPAAGLALLT